MKTLRLCLFPIFLIGCSTQPQKTQMSEEFYNYYSYMPARIKACFMQGYYDVNFAHRSQTALIYSLNFFTYNQNKLSHLQKMYMQDSALKINSDICKSTQLSLYKVIEATENHKSRKIEQKRPVSSESPTNMNCYNYGFMTSCNTF